MKSPIFKKGDRVQVYNRTLGGDQVDEGVAVLVYDEPFDFISEGVENWIVYFEADEDKTHFHRNIRHEDKIEGDKK